MHAYIDIYGRDEVLEAFPGALSSLSHYYQQNVMHTV